ncbi:hypothetical protein H0H93_001656 [Arthromyces matolae]|nr:hypothetical protein H0H93_001656 [Arthromyces matolae]
MKPSTVALAAAYTFSVCTSFAYAIPAMRTDTLAARDGPVLQVVRSNPSVDASAPASAPVTSTLTERQEQQLWRRKGFEDRPKSRFRQKVMNALTSSGIDRPYQRWNLEQLQATSATLANKLYDTNARATLGDQQWSFDVRALIQTTFEEFFRRSTRTKYTEDEIHRLESFMNFFEGPFQTQEVYNLFQPTEFSLIQNSFQQWKNVILLQQQT